MEIYQINDVINIDNFIIEDFITDNINNENFLEKNKKYYDNFLLHLFTLHGERQLLIQNNENGEMVGILGWIRINPEDEYKINKIRWKFPKDIKSGNILHITFCVCKGGDIHQFKEK
ncbi:MAG: hypothetical protein AABY22_17425, partial [Nanoarchaeota archaeon]